MKPCHILSFAVLVVFLQPAHAQVITKSVSDGVFTADQAARGKVAFDGTCARCHNVALVGSERGPAIKGPDFLTHWEKDNLAGLFIKIRDTMPQGGPGTISDEVKIDILTYILQQNGFGGGKEELKVNLSALEDIRFGKVESGPVNFSLVEVVGCLADSGNKRWKLTNSSEPVSVKDETFTSPELRGLDAKPTGSLAFELVSVNPAFKPETHRTQKVAARGLLYRDGSYAEINLTAMEPLGGPCTQ